MPEWWKGRRLRTVDAYVVIVCLYCYVGYKYTEKEFIKAVKENKSITSVINSLNLRPAGGNYQTVRLKIAKLNLDISHFKGDQGWSKGLSLKEYKDYKHSKSVRHKLINERGHICEECKKKEWNSKKIPLELHHINGNRLDNNIENLQILCPNCHALTDNFRGKNNNRRMAKLVTALGLSPNIVRFESSSLSPPTKTHRCIKCNNEVSKKSKTGLCKTCYKRTPKIDWPDVSDLIRQVEETSYSALSRVLGVSDNAIRKRIKRYS